MTGHRLAFADFVAPLGAVAVEAARRVSDTGFAYGPGVMTLPLVLGRRCSIRVFGHAGGNTSRLLGNPYDCLFDLHRTYGPVCRFGFGDSKYVMMFGAEANKLLLSDSPKRPRFLLRDVLGLLIPVRMIDGWRVGSTVNAFDDVRSCIRRPWAAVVVASSIG